MDYKKKFCFFFFNEAMKNIFYFCAVKKIREVATPN